MPENYIPPIRADLAAERPYGAPQLSVPVAPNVNENTHDLPDELKSALLGAFERVVSKLNRYPDREFLELRDSIARYLGHSLQVEQVWAANGSNEVLQQLFLAFGGHGRSVMSFVPSYSMYANLALLSATRFIPIGRSVDFSLDLGSMLVAVANHNPDLVLICNPNNPTGTLTSLATISAVAAATEGLVVVDEAYAEFSEQESALSLLQDHPNLVVSRTMSKAFSFAGVRLGYLAAHPAIVDSLRVVRLPYHLSALTQAAAITAFQFADSMLASVRDIVKERERVALALEQLGLQPYKSSSNFLLVAGFSSPEKTFDELLSSGILVRNVGIPHTLRITVGTQIENDQLLTALAASSRG